MKKKFLLFTAFMTLILGLSVVLAACGNTGSTAEYQVTVLNADETPLEGVTVLWKSGSKTSGSAVTDADGVAKATLAAANYTVSLSGIAEGTVYDAVTVGSILSKVTITLRVSKVLYTATVIDKDGKPAVGVTVNWLSGTGVAGTAVTDASGKAERELDYGDYTVVLASGLPAGNVYNGVISSNGKTPNVSFALEGGVSFDYSVTLKTEGGLLFNNQSVFVYKGSQLVASGKTDDNGVYGFTNVAGDYTIRVMGLPEGYTAQSLSLSDLNRSGELTLYSSVVTSKPSSSLRYLMGDIIHDYNFKVPYIMQGETTNRTYSIKDLLDPTKGDKKAIFINNWGTKCSWCVQEMPLMQEAYEKYGDDIEIIAVSNYNGGDSVSVITSFYQANSYTFPMVRDNNNFVSKFQLKNYPTTIVIDRYGAVARIESGAILYAEVWDKLIERYIADDYVQTFKRGDSISDSITSEISKPDFEVDPDHYDKINESELGLGGEVEWFGSDNEYAWPYMYDVVDGVSEGDEKLLYASNSGRGNTTAIIYAYVEIPAGKVFTFDYYCQSETLDVLSVYWDGQVVQEISGSDPTWRTCYLFSELASGRHLLALTYAKDPGLDVGKDNVFIKNVRFAESEEIPEGTDMLRAAAYGIPQADATQYPHYAKVSIVDDGYYHVNLSSLQNSNHAGADPSPMLFANLMTATNWSTNSISAFVTGKREEDGEYAVDCNFIVNGVKKDWRDELIEYCRAASASDLYGLIPVDKEFYDLLIAFMTRVKETFNKEGDKELRDDNEWLEICYFYSHYGNDGEFIGSPIVGLTEKTAINVNDILDNNGEWKAELTRVMYPFPVTIYAYTAPDDGLYRIQSLIPVATGEEDQKGAQIWLYNDETSSDEPLIHSGNGRFIRDGVNEHNFDIYRYMYANEKYYIAVAYLNSESGTYDCRINKVESGKATVLEPCSENEFKLAVDANGNPSLMLLGAIDYEYDADADRYYEIKSNGTRGSLIYLDTKYALAFSRFSLSELVDLYEQDPKDFTALTYKMFDFRYRVAYFTEEVTENGESYNVINYNPQMSLTSYGEKYKDCTDIMKGYITDSLKDENDGLIPVNKEIKEILDLFIETRLNMLLDEKQDSVLENEWLRFCWYYRVYDENSR